MKPWEDIICLLLGAVLAVALVYGALQGCDELERQRGKECYEKTRSEECWRGVR